jgi:hypothetical protein
MASTIVAHVTIGKLELSEIVWSVTAMKPAICWPGQ